MASLYTFAVNQAREVKADLHAATTLLNNTRRKRISHKARKSEFVAAKRIERQTRRQAARVLLASPLGGERKLAETLR